MPYAEVSLKNDSTVYVGLDVHKDSIVAAYSVGLGEVHSLGNIGVLDRDLNRLCTRMQSKAAQVSFVYEAGPCGYGLHRFLTRKGFACMVCAPSLIARKPGDRVKTDRRDAILLTKALRMDDLTGVHVPDVEDEAFGDLVRGWSASKHDLRQARQRLKSFLLVHSVRYAGTAKWEPAHRRWLSEFVFPAPWSQIAFKFPVYAHRYLAEAAWRFNRRCTMADFSANQETDYQPSGLPALYAQRGCFPDCARAPAAYP